MDEKEELFYKKATDKLLATIEKMGMEKISRIRAKNLALYFRDSFKLENVKYQTFDKENADAFRYCSDGFCRASSIDFALMMGGGKDWKLMYIDDMWAHGPHHYLLHVPSNTILDLTYDQYAHSGITIPYFLGKPTKLYFDENESEGRFAKALNLMPMIAANKQKE